MLLMFQILLVRNKKQAVCPFLQSIPDELGFMTTPLILRDKLLNQLETEIWI